MDAQQVQAIIAEKVRQVASALEDQVDEELHRLEMPLSEDDVEAMRQKRLAQLRRGAQKKQEWLARGHGDYRDLPGEKARRCQERLTLSRAAHSHCAPGVLRRDEGRGADGLPLLQRLKLGLSGASAWLLVRPPSVRVSALLAYATQHAQTRLRPSTGESTSHGFSCVCPPARR
jgi:hypothetical protein